MTLTDIGTNGGIQPMRLADIDFSKKTMYYYEDRDMEKPLAPNRICKDEYFFLSGLADPNTNEYKTIAFPYYRKLYAYYDRFGNSMPNSLRIALLQEIEASI